MTTYDDTTIAEIIHVELGRHAAYVGPISGSWRCPCGTSSTNGDIHEGDLTTPDERAAEYRAHVTEDLAEILERRMVAEVIAETELLTKQRNNAERRHERLESAVESLAKKWRSEDDMSEWGSHDKTFCAMGLEGILAEQIRTTETEGAK